MRIDILLLITIVCIYCSRSYAQEVEIVTEKKTKYLEIDVIKTYERIVLKGYKSVDLFEKIGNSYYDNLEMEKAANWYRQLFEITSELESKYYYQYAESLRLTGKNDEANAVIEKFNKKNRKR